MQIGRAMRAGGFIVSNEAIHARLANAGGRKNLAGDEDIDRYLRTPGGSLNPAPETVARLRADGFALDNKRVYARHRQQKQEDGARAAAGGQPLSREPGGPAGHS